MCWIEGAMKLNSTDKGGIYEAEDLSAINAACIKTRSILRIFSLLRNGTEGPGRDVTVTLALLDEGFVDVASVQEGLPLGVSLPLLEILFRCRNQGALAELPGWSAAAWMLVGRQDLGMNMPIDGTAFPADSVARRRSDAIVRDVVADAIPENDKASEDEVKDGLTLMERSSAMFFPDDNRVHEAARLLCSSRPIFLRVTRAVEVSDHDFERMKQKRLLQYYLPLQIIMPFYVVFTAIGGIFSTVSWKGRPVK